MDNWKFFWLPLATCHSAWHTFYSYHSHSLLIAHWHTNSDLSSIHIHAQYDTEEQISCIIIVCKCPMVAFQVYCHKCSLPKLHLLTMRRSSVAMVWDQIYIKVSYKQTASQNSNGQHGSFPVIFRYLTFSKKREELIDRLPNPANWW